MALPDEGPCGWDVDWCALPTGLTEEDRVAQLDAATLILYKLTGNRYPGTCDATRSFCPPTHACGCSSRCRCGPDSYINLGGEYPVASIVRVTVDGDDLIDGVDYRVDDWSRLVRLDSESWPSVTDLEDPEALEVHWTYGRTPPAGGSTMVGVLATELALACQPGSSCRLPQRTVSASAEGVVVTLIDPQRIIADGGTGLTEVDMWVHAVNQDSPSTGGIFDPGACGRAVATDTGAPGAT